MLAADTLRDMRLPVPQDSEIRRRLRADQDDPLVMYFVLLKTTEASLAQIAANAARAAWRCADEMGQMEAHAADFDEWFEGSFRKVCLRAKAGQFNTVLQMPHVREGDIVCLPPQRAGARDAIFDKLQALQAVKSEEPLPVFDKPAARPQRDLVINSELGMKAGKTIAQIGHAALMLRSRIGGAAPDFTVTATGRWEAVLEAHDALAVRDGGLTEIAAGSETVLALA